MATYQAVSGAGQAAIEELRSQTRAALDGAARPVRVFPVPCAFNVFPHESDVDLATGLCGEERKMVAETRRIWDAPDLPVHAMCVRVPVERAHSQAIVVELDRAASIDEVERVLHAAPGVRFFPRVGEAQPTPLLASGEDEVLVGRVRLDREGGRRLSLWVCCDQLRKGAALNALQVSLGAWRHRRESRRSVLNGVIEVR
ncbi:MAG: Asd/ArgC dimerization domain-containing protein [Phycisphaerales bacterium]